MQLSNGYCARMITQAMILAAGEGRRLRPLTQTTPKPLIHIGGTTMLDHALNELEKVGVTRCVVNTHHLADQIESHIQERVSPEITISYEPELLDTGGGLAKALPYFGDNPFFVLNADIWWQDVGYSALTQLNKLWDSTKMDALLLLVPRENAMGYAGSGDYFLDADGHIHYRREKASAPNIFSGIRIIHPRLLVNQEVRPFSIMPLFHKAESQGRLYGMLFDGEWGDIGTLESLEVIQLHLSKKGDELQKQTWKEDAKRNI